MDHWSYSLHLAQMPTDQRELEQHRLPVQTGAADSDGFLQTNASQPYHPCPPEESWAAPRSTLAPGSLIALHPGYSDPWAMLGPYDIPPHLARSLAPESTVLTHLPTSPSNGASIITSPPSTMDHPSPTTFKRRHSQDLVDWNTDPITSPWLGQANSSYSQWKMENSEPSNSKLMYGVSPSPPISISPQHSPSQSTQTRSSASPTATTRTTTMAMDGTSPRTSLTDNSEEEHPSELPYSHLIYQALLTGEGQQMPLQEIYAWFEKNTNKGKDQSCKGWQNSIRHNLSMNAGFEAIKVDVEGGKRPLSVWRLTEEARRNGKVESTTRYRKIGHRRPSDHSAPLRQGAGARGRKATKNGTKKQHPSPEEQRRERYRTQPMLHQHCQQQQQQQLPQPQPQPQVPIDNPKFVMFPPAAPELVPYPMPPTVTSLSQAHRGSLHSWDYSSVTGCTDPPPGENPVFCDPEPTADCTAFMGQPDWCVLGPNNGSTTIPEGHSDVQLV